MNEEPESLPLSAYDEGKSNLPDRIPDQGGGQVAIQTTGGGSVARKIANPRQLTTVMNNIKIMAAMAGEDWYYSWPTKNKDGSKGVVEGPSIKCATAVARMYGNCEIDCILKESATHYIFEAHFTDLETGFHLMRPYQQRKQQNIGGKMDAARQADVIFQIGVSKATRNVVNNALETFTDFAKEEAKKSLVDKIGKNLPGSRLKIIALFAENGIDLKRVERVYAKVSGEWMAPDIAKMIAEVRAIADGMVNKDDTYPPTEEENKAHETAASEAATIASKETSAESTDWDEFVSGLIAGLQSCKDAGAVSLFLDENQPSMETLSKAPPEINAKWTKAMASHMQHVSPKKTDQQKGK